jgi:Heparinase II/III-like protein/Heparinase II/III N-terminus
MMRGARRVLSQVRSRLRALLPSERPHKPDWSERAMQRVLCEQGDPAIMAWAHGLGQGAALRERVCRHFRERSAPAFFATPAELAALAAAAPAFPRPPPAPARAAGQRPRYTEHGILAAAAAGWRDPPAGPGNDILYPARPHRFAQAPLLALAALRDPKHHAELAGAVQGWQRYAGARGPMAYLSNLVVLQRLLALSWAWAFVAARPAAEVEDGFALEFNLLQIIRADCRFLLPLLGDSFPNNHLLADTFAGWYIHTLFPEFVPGPADAAAHDAVFRRELERQVLDDGSGFEHATHYHEFGCEMALAHRLLTPRQPGGTVEPWSHPMLQRMLRFQIDLAGPACTPAAVGNATEDPLFPLDAGSSWATGAFRECYRALFDATLAPAPAADPTVERAYWLLGGRLAPATAAAPDTAEAGAFASYPHGGFYVFAEADPRGTQLVLRSGPAAGARVMGGHMHADLLSITATVGGRPLLVDTGTYSYRLAALDDTHGAGGWRAYFGGPESHNGPVLAGADPIGPITDDFRPRDPAGSARVMAEHTGGALRWIEAAVEGPTPCQGLRRGVVQVCGHYWLVLDTAPGEAAAAALSYRFQLAPGCRLAPQASQPSQPLQPLQQRSLAIDDGAVRLAWSDALDAPRVLQGSLQPRGGWVSPEYGELVAAPQLVFPRSAAAVPGSAAAFVWQTEGAAIEQVEHQALPGGGHALRIMSAEFADFVLLAGDSAALPLQAWGIRFDGSVGWLRLHREGHAVEMRWLRGRSLHLAAVGVAITSAQTLDQLQWPPRSEPAAEAGTAAWPPGFEAVWPGTAGHPFIAHAGVGT